MQEQQPGQQRHQPDQVRERPDDEAPRAEPQPASIPSTDADADADADAGPDPADDAVNRAHRHPRLVASLSSSRSGSRHVASPGVCPVATASWSSNRSASSLSSPWIRTGPAADAVVAVTLARPKIRSPSERWLSIVWILLIGAIRQCTENQPALVYRAWSVTSQRCTRYRQRGMITACAPSTTTVAAITACQAGGNPLIE